MRWGLFLMITGTVLSGVLFEVVIPGGVMNPVWWIGIGVAAFTWAVVSHVIFDEGDRV